MEQPTKLPPPPPAQQDDIIFRSKLPDIYIPNHLPLHSYCFQNISDHRSKPCLINAATGESLTYADVELTTRRVAAGLHSRGIAQRDTIMLLLPNTPEFAFSFLAASFLGATTTMANPFFTPAEILKQAKASRAKLIVTQSCHVDKVLSYALENDVMIACIDALPPSVDPKNVFHFSELTRSNESEMPEVEIDPNDVVALPYSSGTTGLPKGVMLTHKGLVTSVAQQVDGENPNLDLTSDDVFVCVLPMFHIYALNSILLCGLRVGAAIVLVQKFEIGSFMGVLERYKVTYGPFVPPIVVAIAKSEKEYDLSAVRMVQSGAAPLGKEVEEAVRLKFPNATIGQGYGMTEAGPVLALCLAFAKEPFEVKSGACGTVMRNAEMKIVDPETGHSLPRNQPGEICIRGDQIMKGYLNDQEATENTIDKGGWLHTGDIGFIDDDNDELFIVDRLKELIKYNGYQVAPAELEALLLSHSDILDAAVVGMQDEKAGEVPVAFVVRSNGSKITEEDVKLYISKQVVFYKRIKRVFFTNAIPKAPSGKILRKDLRAQLAAGLPN